MAANVVDLAKYDITRKMAPFLDPHFMFPILKWLRERNIYSEAEVLAAEYDLASNTSTMFTYLQELHKHLVDTVKATGGDVSKVPSPDFNTSALEAEFKQHMDAGGKVWELLGDKAVIDKLREAGKFTLEGLVEEGATEEEIESIFDLARFYHKGGLYKQALECVVLFRKVGPRFDSYRYFSTMWAQLAECICMILNPDTPSTKKPLSSAGGSEPSDFAFRVLRDTVEKRTMLGVQEVEHRRWLLHWALFVIFSRPRAHDELFDLFFSQREARSEQRTRKNDYLAITQAVSPWLLRYVAYATVLNFQNLGKRQRQFINVLKAEKATYSGPMTQLFVSLFSECDIEGSIAAIRESADVIRADFFLGNLAAKARGSVDDVINDFQSAALKLVFHEILKLHQEVPYEQAISKYFSEFPSVDANTLRGWVAELDRATSGNSKSSVVDETKESVHCHQLFNVQITTIHQRIDQQTNELKSMANKLRNRLNEDRAFERDMNSGAAGRGGRGDDFERVPFKNQVNSRDPRNQDKEIQPQAPPKPQNSRWQQDEKVAEPAPQPAGSADDQNWQRSTKKPQNNADSGSWERGKGEGAAKSKWR